MSAFRARSAIYVPGDHTRAMSKAPCLAADILIYDLEDGVAPDAKATARRAITAALAEPAAKALRLVRINHRETKDYARDVAALLSQPVEGIMLSKVAGVADIDDICAHCAKASRADLAIWCNVETPLGIAHAREIAAHPRVAGIVAGTNDLANELRIRRTSDRAGMMVALQSLVLAARAYDKIVLDGTFVDLDDLDGLKTEAEQGRMLGFDGKTLIHPKQIEIANAVFSPSEAELDEAREIVRAYEAAMRENKAVTLLNGRMIEALHYRRAQEILSK